MRTEYYLFHVQGVTSGSRVNFFDSLGISLSLYCLVCCLLFKCKFSRVITSFGEERESWFSAFRIFVGSV